MLIIYPMKIKINGRNTKSGLVRPASELNRIDENNHHGLDLPFSKNLEKKAKLIRIKKIVRLSVDIVDSN